MLGLLRRAKRRWLLEQYKTGDIVILKTTSAKLPYVVKTTSHDASQICLSREYFFFTHNTTRWVSADCVDLEYTGERTDFYDEIIERKGI